MIAMQTMDGSLALFFSSSFLYLLCLLCRWTLVAVRRWPASSNAYGEPIWRFLPPTITFKLNVQSLALAIHYQKCIEYHVAGSAGRWSLLCVADYGRVVDAVVLSGRD